MKGLFIMMIPILVSFLLIIPDVSASSVLDSGRGGEYEYTVQSKEALYSWKVGHKGDVSTIKENKGNEGTLDNFRHAVNEIHTRELELISSISYLLIVLITLIFLHWKKKKVPIKPGILIPLIICFALYKVITSSMDFNNSLDDGKFYYASLMSLK